MANELATRPANDLIAQITTPQMLARIKTAMPEYLNPERQVNLMCQAIRKNADLGACHPLTVINSLMEASALGLEPNSPMQHCAIIPYKGNAQLQIMFKGLIQLALRSGTVDAIWAECVYEKDVFSHEMGAHPKLIHKPYLPTGDKDDRGKIVATYACCRSKGSDEPTFVVMNEHDIAHVRKSAKTSNVWEGHPAEMRKKTAIKRLAKTLNLSPQFMQAAALDDEMETGERQTFSAGGIIDVDYEEGAKADKDQAKLEAAKAKAAAAKAKAAPTPATVPAGQPQSSAPAGPSSDDDAPPPPTDEEAAAAGAAPSEAPAAKQEEPPAEQDAAPIDFFPIRDVLKLADGMTYSTKGKIHNCMARPTSATNKRQSFSVTIFEGASDRVTMAAWGSVPEWAKPGAEVLIEEATTKEQNGRIYHNIKRWRPVQP